jgi:hypothetical protein
MKEGKTETKEAITIDMTRSCVLLFLIGVYLCSSVDSIGLWQPGGELSRWLLLREVFPSVYSLARLLWI